MRADNIKYSHAALLLIKKVRQCLLSWSVGCVRTFFKDAFLIKYLHIDTFHQVKHSRFECNKVLLFSDRSRRSHRFETVQEGLIVISGGRSVCTCVAIFFFIFQPICVLMGGKCRLNFRLQFTPI